MSELAERLEQARAEVARLEREKFAASCAEIGHDWRHIGGRSCGCHPEAFCSVPVYECARCKGCDYGDNAEATETKAECAILFEPEEPRP